MAKIKITEGELKQVIRESVENIINEVKWNKYGTPWDMLSDIEKKNYAYYYANKYKAWKTDGKGNYIYQNGKAVPDYNKLEQIYNQEQEKYQHKGNRGQYSQGHIENLNQQLQTAQANAEKYMGQLNTINKKITDALSMFKINEVTDRAPETNPETNTPAAPDITTMEANIDKLVAHITNLNGELNKAKTNYTTLQKRYTNLATTYNKTIQAQKNQAMAQQGQAKIQTQPIPTARPLGNPTQNVNPNVNA